MAPPEPLVLGEKITAIPEDPKKHIKSGLYISAKDAYAMWQSDQASIKVLDCRTPEEYAFVGHAPMAINVPIKFTEYKWDPKKQEYQMSKNPEFLTEVKKRFQLTDTILVMCRSGHRRAESCNALIQAGYKKIYNIVDGFEGDKEKTKIVQILASVPSMAGKTPACRGHMT